MDSPVSPTVLVHHVVQIPLEPLHKRPQGATSSAVAEAMAGQASTSSLRLGEDVPATFAIFLQKNGGWNL